MKKNNLNNYKNNLNSYKNNFIKKHFLKLKETRIVKIIMKFFLKFSETKIGKTIIKYFLKFRETRIGKIIIAIIIFILIFDKATILLITYIYTTYFYNKKKENYINNNTLVTTIFEPSNNTIALLSNVFKHPELNLKSYTNIKLDPTKMMFEDNKFLPECCFYNSEYSSSKGCPCITADQQSYLNTRGTNKSYISFIQTNNDYKNKIFSPTLAFHGISKPFKSNDEKFITNYEPLNVIKKNEFTSLINMH
jgi:hypothetical protein